MSVPCPKEDCGGSLVPINVPSGTFDSDYSRVYQCNTCRECFHPFEGRHWISLGAYPSSKNKGEPEGPSE